MHPILFHISGDAGMDGCLWRMSDDAFSVSYLILSCLVLSYPTGMQKRIETLKIKINVLRIVRDTSVGSINNYIVPKELVAPWDRV